MQFRFTGWLILATAQDNGLSDSGVCSRTALQLLRRAALEAALREMGSLNAQYAMRHVQVVSETLHSYSENSITRKG